MAKTCGSPMMWPNEMMKNRRDVCSDDVAPYNEDTR